MSPRFNYDAAGLGFAILFGALIVGVASGIISVILGTPPDKVAAGLLVLPFVPILLAVGVMVFVLPFLVAACITVSAVDYVKGKAGPTGNTVSVTPSVTPVAPCDTPRYDCSLCGYCPHIRGDALDWVRFDPENFWAMRPQCFDSSACNRRKWTRRWAEAATQ